MKYLIPLLFLIFFSCSNDCSDCENNLKMCLMNQPVPLDLPTPTEEIYPSNNEAISVIVTVDDQYIYNNLEYSFDELTRKIDDEISNTEDFNDNLKIEGDKMAHYESIFQLINFAKERELKPILVYKDK